VEWGTAYATHMLLDAQKRKYAVPQDRIFRLAHGAIVEIPA